MTSLRSGLFPTFFCKGRALIFCHCVFICELTSVGCFTAGLAGALTSGEAAFLLSCRTDTPDLHSHAKYISFLCQRIKSAVGRTMHAQTAGKTLLKTFRH